MNESYSSLSVPVVSWIPWRKCILIKALHNAQSNHQSLQYIQHSDYLSKIKSAVIVTTALLVIVGLGFSIVCELSLYNVYQICHPLYPHTSALLMIEGLGFSIDENCVHTMCNKYAIPLAPHISVNCPWKLSIVLAACLRHYQSWPLCGWLANSIYSG